MKNITLTLIIGAIFFIIQPLAAQDKVFDKKSDTVCQATVYDVDYVTGKPNVYPHEDYGHFTNDYNKLLSLRMNILTYNGKKYHVLIDKHRDMGLKYHYIQSGETEGNDACHAFVMDDVQYGRFKAALDTKTTDNVLITARVNVSVTGLDPTDEMIIKAVIQGFDISKNAEYDSYCFPITVQKSNGEDVVRFELTGPCPFDVHEPLNVREKRKKKELPIKNTELLKTYYYEMKYSEFIKLLID